MEGTHLLAAAPPHLHNNGGGGDSAVKLFHGPRDQCPPVLAGLTGDPTHCAVLRANHC